jgi:hypothetical protein
MNIVIKSIDGYMIEFNSAIGRGIARWEGKTPSVNQEYSVEIDINDKFEWGSNIFPVKDTSPNIKMNGSTLSFIAKVIAWESDGVLVASLENDIVLIEAPLPPAKNISYVSFYTRNTNVSLYPIDL